MAAGGITMDEAKAIIDELVHKLEVLKCLALEGITLFS